MSNTVTGYTAGTTIKGNVPQGTANGKLFDVTGPKWTQANPDINSPIPMEAKTLGYSNGTKAVFEVYERDITGTDKRIAVINSSVSGGQITGNWDFKQYWKTIKPKKMTSCPKYFFTCTCKDDTAKSGLLELKVDITVKVFDQNNSGMRNVSYICLLATNQIKKGVTDSSGKIVLAGVPVGCHTIKFPGNPLIGGGTPLQISQFGEIIPYPLNILEENVFKAVNCAICCSHKIDEKLRLILNPPKYEVVPSVLKGATEEPDKLLIYCDKNISIREKQNTAITTTTAMAKNGHKFSVNEMEVKRRPNGQIRAFYDPQFWRDLSTTREYEIQGLSNNIPVKVYAPDTYTVSLKFPTIGAFKSGEKYIKEKTEKVEEKISSVMPKFLKKLEKPEGATWPPLSKPLPLRSDFPVSFQINGMNLSCSLLEAFGAIMAYQRKIIELIRNIKQFVPEAGGYFDVDCKFFVGSTALQWGYKEHTDHRVFMGFAASIDWSLIDITLEVGIGFKALGAVAQVFMQLKGSLGVSLSLEKNSPDLPMEVKVPVKANIGCGVGGRVKVTVFFQGELIGNTGLEITGEMKLSTESGMTVDLSTKFTGLKMSVAVSAGPGKSIGDGKSVQGTTGQATPKEWVFIEEKDFGSLNLFSSQSANPQPLAQTQICRIVDDMFKKEGGVMVMVRQGRLFYQDTLIHEKIGKILFESKYILHEENSIKIMAEKIAKSIRNLYKPGDNSVMSEVVDAYLKGDSFKQMLKEASDPVQKATASLNT